MAVLNINELANSLKPVVLPGEALRVFVLKEGKEQGQGVGYLDDGTMVVVDRAGRALGRTIEVTVTSVLQTAGRQDDLLQWPEGLQSGRSGTSPGGGAPEDRRDPRAGRDYRGEARRDSDLPAERPRAVEPQRPAEGGRPPRRRRAPRPAADGPGARGD